MKLRLLVVTLWLTSCQPAQQTGLVARGGACAAGSLGQCSETANKR